MAGIAATLSFITRTIRITCMRGIYIFSTTGMLMNIPLRSGQPIPQNALLTIRVKLMILCTVMAPLVDMKPFLTVIMRII